MTTLVDAPARVDGLQLVGETVGSGYRTPPSLVTRGDGQVLQLTPLLYQVLKAVDGRRSCAEIADLVSRKLRKQVTEDHVRTVIDGHLRPLGLLKRADGSEPEVKRSNPLLSLKARIAVTDPRSTRRLTDPFRVLFSPVLISAIVLGFLAVVGWVFFEHGLGASAYDAFERPHLLLLVFVVSVLSGGFHEFGHAAAARYSGAQPGVMGVGLYLVWPAFYTDVTDSYRLGRAGRIRTDLGGLYFNAIVVVLTFVWWWATGWEALLLLVATQVLQMVQQLLPLLRFDGYHVLADLAGVPDLYHRIRPTLTGLLPHRWKAPENRVLKPKARALITLWVLVTIPMMTLMLLGVIAAVPRLLGSAGAVVREDLTSLAREDNALDLAAHVLQILGVLLPTLACALVLGRVGVRFFGGLSRWSRGSAGKRAVAALVSAVAVTTLSWVWWPHPGNYRPIGPDERSLVASLMPGTPTGTAELARPVAAVPDGADALPAGAAAQRRLADDAPSLVATFEKGAELPTKDDPVLAAVLVPADGTSTEAPGHAPSGAPSAPAPSGAASSSSAPTTGDTTPTTQPSPNGVSGQSPAPSPGIEGSDDAWVFPFDRPLPADAGDNQALAVNTRDGSIVYDVAFALVWVEDDEVLNVNEAHAYASCSDCVAVAVAFQVVLIMDDAQVVVPQNLAVAANYDCYRCITAAVASQLVLSVQEEPGEEELLALGEVWNQLLQFASTITSRSLVEIDARLEAFKAQIVAILGSAPPVESTPEATATGSAEGLNGSTTTGSPPGVPTASPTGQLPTSEPGSTQPGTPSTMTSPQGPTASTPSPTQPSATAPQSSTAPTAPTSPAPQEPTASTSPAPQEPTASTSSAPPPEPTTSSSPTGDSAAPLSPTGGTGASPSPPESTSVAGSASP